MDEGAPVLEIRPQLYLLERSFFQETPEAIITDALIQRVARKISRLVLQNEFKTDAVVADIITTARDEMEAAFLSVIHEEKESRTETKGKKYLLPRDPLLRCIEEKMGPDIQPEAIRLSVPDDFFKGFAQTVKVQRRTLDYLERAREHPIMKAYILPLLQQLSAFDKDGWHLVEGGAEKAYNVIKPLADDMRYTIPHAEAELLYILTYVPSSVRHPAQELLVHHSYMSFVQEQRAAAQEKAEPTEMHEVLLQCLKLGIFTNSHWQRLSNYNGSSETMNAELAETQVLFKQATKKMMELAQQNPAYAQVLETFLAYTKGLFERIEHIDRKQGCYALQQTDIGHGFRTQFLRDCHYALLPDSLTEHKRQKDGSVAVILEDDPRQMANWKSLLQDNSPYSLLDDGKGEFETPSHEILKHADDPRVRLFLIDIQNNDDQTAGIRVAEALVRKLLEQCRTQAPKRAERDEQKSVIVWSTSPELANIASQHFKEFCEREDPDKKYITHSHGNAPIILHVQLKCDHLSFTA